MKNKFNKLDSLSSYGVIFIRLAFGFHLLYYSWEPVIHLTAGSSAGFLQKLGIPFPTLMAWIYTLVEFLGGIALIIGYKTRLVALPLIITFLVAWLGVHLHDTYKASFQAIQLLAVSFFFLFHGSGALSLDALLNKGVSANGESI